MLAKTAGVKHLVTLVNKMDDSTVNWEESRYIVTYSTYIAVHLNTALLFLFNINMLFVVYRYNEIESKLSPFLKKVGFKASGMLERVCVFFAAQACIIFKPAWER